MENFPTDNLTQDRDRSVGIPSLPYDTRPAVGEKLVPVLSGAKMKRLQALADYYDGKTILVTGGSSGIGQSAALLLSSLGANVLVLARTASDLEATLSLLEQSRRHSRQKFKSYQADLRNAESIMKVVDEIQRDFSIDILINNAGVTYTKYFTDQSPKEIENMVLTNLLAPLQLTRALIPHFLRRGGGQVVNVSSLAAKLNFTGYGVYGGTKAGLSHSTKGLEFEFAPKGVCFSTFFPPDSLTRGYEEELKTMPVETKKINGAVKPLDATDVALALLEGVSKKQSEIVPGFKSQAVAFLSKHLPHSILQKTLRLLSQ